MQQVIITGKPGVGKTTLLNELKARGFKTFSCDEVVWQLYQFNQPGFKIIKKALGNKFVNENGVDKKALWTAIVNQDITITELNQLIHPLINQQLQKLHFNFCECPIIGSPFLDHSKFVIIKLDVGNEIAIQRLIKSKNINYLQATQIINLFQDNIKTNVIFNTANGINNTFVQKVINYYQSL